MKPSTKPLVSIVIPSHERPDYTSLALKSVQEQTYEHLQIIVSDNSTEHDVRAAMADQVAADPRVSFVHQPTSNFMRTGSTG